MESPGVIFISNYEPHAVVPVSSEYERYITAFNPYQLHTLLSSQLLRSVFSVHPIGFSHHIDLNPIGQEFDLLFQRFFQAYQSEKPHADEGVSVWLNALVRLLFEAFPNLFSECSGHADSIVTQVRAELETNLRKRLELDSLAEKYFVSKYYLTHLFKKHTGYSLKEYQLLCRISRACELLSNRDYTIMEVASICGMNDVSNFSRYFRQCTGVTPSRYRNGIFRTGRPTDPDSKEEHNI